MPAQTLFSELLGDIYEASYQPSYWPVVIEKICRLTNSCSGGLIIQDRSLQEANAHYHYGWSEQKLFHYANHRHHDPAFTIMQHKPVGEAVNIQGASQHDLESRDYYEDVRLTNDLGYLAGAKVIDNEMQVVGLGLHRGFSASSYDHATLQLISDLIPHLQRALRIHREFVRLRVENSALSAGFEHLTMGLVLLDHMGAPAYINPVAREILDSHPAISITNEIVTPVNREAATQLRRMILDCLETAHSEARQPGGVIGLHHETRRHPLAVMVKPVATSEFANMVDGIPVYVALYLTDPSRPLAISADSLGQLYDLTRIESQIAIALANGMGVEEIAQAHGRSINTVRTQLRSIFQKTNTNSQADLIRLLLTGAA
jgi:DNA-binding CsgD family transcriptional regulator